MAIKKIKNFFNLFLYELSIENTQYKNNNRNNIRRTETAILEHFISWIYNLSFY